MCCALIVLLCNSNSEKIGNFNFLLYWTIMRFRLNLLKNLYLFSQTYCILLFTNFIILENFSKWVEDLDQFCNHFAKGNQSIRNWRLIFSKMYISGFSCTTQTVFVFSIIFWQRENLGTPIRFYVGECSKICSEDPEVIHFYKFEM